MTSERMQAIARDLAAPTTGFVNIRDSGAGSLPIRSFSPQGEMTACGYVALAAATALRDQGLWTAPGTGVLAAAGGDYVITLRTDVVQLDVPVRSHRALAHNDHSVLAASLDLPLDTQPCEVVATGLRHLIVPIADDRALSAYAPDRPLIERLGASFDVDTIALISDHGDRGAVRLRDLCAPTGVLEEPASGTTSAAVTDFKHRHHGCDSLVARQGEDMGRPSVIRTAIRSDRVVEILGTAHPILTGRLH